MAEIGRFTPISAGIVGLRAVLIDGRQSLAVGGDGGLLWMVAISAAYLVIGIAVFSLGERIARNRGSLGRYYRLRNFLMGAPRRTRLIIQARAARLGRDRKTN